MSKYIIVNPATGKAVQNWSFADKKHILYCTSPKWAMKFVDEESAKRCVDFLKKNFNAQNLTVLKVTFNTTITFG